MLVKNPDAAPARVHATIKRARRAGKTNRSKYNDRLPSAR
jgi:hypothetical protein